ncbi:MAG TPA: HAMP domain-containing sensor histidine kinase [Gaiellales bacterium]
MSETLHMAALLGPIALATLVTSLLARPLLTRARLAYTLVAIAVIASLVTVLDLLVLGHYMLINEANRTELVSVALYSVTAGVAAALIVGRSNTRALRRLVTMARSLGENRLDARAGDLRAGPELRLLGETLDRAAARLAAGIEAERAIEAQRRDLMTSLSHDLRTPIANLRAMVEAIDEGIVRDPETLTSYTAEMRRSVMALVTMVDDLFELAQVDAAEFARDARSVPLAEAVQSALELCRPEAAEKRIRLEIDLGDAGRSTCSPKLARVVHSLLDNAVRYTQAGGRVTLRAGLDADGINLTVEDSGPGIAADELPRVFEAFWRADPARASRGSGLGLTLAKRIVEALGGRIEASSGPERGSRFEVSVPTRA